MFKTKEEAVEFAKEFLMDTDNWLSDINIFPSYYVDNQGGHTQSEKCACKPRVEKDEGFKVIHHHLLVH